jgi:1-pyrroline-5-carboxylate dehydrogenase
VVGAAGGKGFVVVHPSFDQFNVLSTALLCGSFKCQGQKGSATSRSYIPRSLWTALKEGFIDDLPKVKVGDVLDFYNFVNVVHEKAAYESIMSYIDYAKSQNV